jgi:hypothetical protein
MFTNEDIIPETAKRENSVPLSAGPGASLRKVLKKSRATLD